MNALLQQYSDLIAKWNERINLTAISGADFESKHVADALALLPHLGDARSLIDLGTGAGIPGIIIKIERPDIAVTLVDATRKKISFCEEAIRKLDLHDIRAVWARAEDESFARSIGTFDIVVSRATWDLADFLRVARRYASKRGFCIAMKGKQWHEELKKAARVLEKIPLTLEGSHPYILKGGEERCILVFRLIEENEENN